MLLKWFLLLEIYNMKTDKKLGIYRYSLAARRLIETFILLHRYTNINYEIFFKLNNTTETRGHNWTLFNPQTTKGLQCRVNFFSLKVINAWNKLPCHLVSATMVTLFVETCLPY